MSVQPEDLKGFARGQLARLYGETEHRDLYASVLSRDKELFSRVTPDTFGMEYLTAKLAMACLAWEGQCGENNLNTEDARKTLFRLIMDGFRSPKMVALATAFSDYYFLCQKESGEPPAIVMVTRMAERLGLGGDSAGPSKQSSLSAPPAFLSLIETLEGFRVSFENECLDFFIRFLKAAD